MSSSSNNQIINFNQINYHDKKIASLTKQIAGQEEYKKMLNIQMHTLEIDLQLIEKEFKRYQLLFDQQTIAESELEKVRRTYLQKKHSVEGAATNLVNIDNQITTMESNILDLNHKNSNNKFY